MTKVKVGVIGGGLISQVEHLPNLLSMPERFEVVGLVDPSAKVRAHLTARHRIQTFATADELFAQKLEAVVIGTPDATHADLAVAALDRGLHVFCEKPLCYAVEDADSVIAARDRAVLRLAVHADGGPAEAELRRDHRRLVLRGVAALDRLGHPRARRVARLGDEQRGPARALERPPRRAASLLAHEHHALLAVRRLRVDRGDTARDARGAGLRAGGRPEGPTGRGDRAGLDLRPGRLRRGRRRRGSGG